MTEEEQSAREDLRSELSYKDLQIYARQLVASLVEEGLQTGKFDRDLAFFNGVYQKRIVSELKQIIRQFNGIQGSTLPPEGKRQRGKSKKGQKEP